MSLRHQFDMGFRRSIKAASEIYPQLRRMTQIKIDRPGAC
jgi:hypothetical protein